MAKRLRGYGDGYKPYAGRRKHPWLKVLLAIILAFLALTACIAVRSVTHLAGQPQVMVIFGCQVQPDGPSQTLRDRLDTALAYLEDHPDMRVVVAGGKGDDEHQSEAACMYDYLTARGVDGGNIWLEDQSRNTWQNVTYTLSLMEEQGWSTGDDVVLVSSGFHLCRIEMLWNRADRAPAASDGRTVSTLAAPVTHRPSAVRNFLREPLALVKSFLLDR